MRFPLLLHSLLGLLLLTTSFCRGPQTETASGVEADTVNAITSEPITVYLVRHAEKDSSEPTNQDPGLAPVGLARAESLRALLEGVPVGALYATKYKRTQQTLKPLADERNLPVKTYESNDFTSLKQRLLREHSGQTVVVAAHSNTLLPLLTQLGAHTKISHISETTYDYLFKVVLNPDQTATLEVDRYGVSPD